MMIRRWLAIFVVTLLVTTLVAFIRASLADAAPSPNIVRSHYNCDTGNPTGDATNCWVSYVYYGQTIAGSNTFWQDSDSEWHMSADDKQPYWNETQLQFRSDCNLFLVAFKQVSVPPAGNVWVKDTSKGGGDGILWRTQLSGRNGCTLRFQDDGNIQIWDSNHAIWTAEGNPENHSAGDRLVDWRYTTDIQVWMPGNYWAPSNFCRGQVC
jgi:hypothetical protein